MAITRRAARSPSHSPSPPKKKRGKKNASDFIDDSDAKAVPKRKKPRKANADFIDDSDAEAVPKRKKPRKANEPGEASTMLKSKAKKGKHAQDPPIPSAAAGAKLKKKAQEAEDKGESGHAIIARALLAAEAENDEDEPGSQVLTCSGAGGGDDEVEGELRGGKKHKVKKSGEDGIGTDDVLQLFPSHEGSPEANADDQSLAKHFKTMAPPNKAQGSEHEDDESQSTGGRYESSEGNSEDEFEEGTTSEEDEEDDDGEEELEEEEDPKHKRKAAFKETGKGRRREARHGRGIELIAEDGDDSLVGPKKKHKKSRSRRSRRHNRTQEEQQDLEERHGPKVVLADFDSTAKKLVRKGREAIRKATCLSQAFPANPSAFIWKVVCDECTSPVEKEYLAKVEDAEDVDSEYSVKEMMITYVGYVVPSMRFEIKDSASTLVPGNYQLLKKAHQADVVKQNVAFLLKAGRLHYGGLDLGCTHSLLLPAPYGNNAIGDVLRSVFFDGSIGTTIKKSFYEMLKLRSIPKPLIALVLATLHHVISEYREGYRVQAKFTTNIGRPIYELYMKGLNSIEEKSPTWFKKYRHTLWLDIMNIAKPAFLLNIDLSNPAEDLEDVDFDMLEATAQKAQHGPDDQSGRGGEGEGEGSGSRTGGVGLVVGLDGEDEDIHKGKDEVAQ
ncbi:hypothetical protein HGRIS_003382 [Hohenbuehelia grisea]|uniref:DUF6532 domain-containing protein n=1 Tax=Hohenbuehelia grisea TaxID=104357 RepID=A0ABR3JGA0_9AGAR